MPNGIRTFVHLDTKELSLAQVVLVDDKLVHVATFWFWFPAVNETWSVDGPWFVSQPGPSDSEQEGEENTGRLQRLHTGRGPGQEGEE